MHHSQIPEKPLNAAVNTDRNILRKEKVYFFEREDGSVFCTNAQEAWGLYNRRVQIVGKYSAKLKLVGTGNGDLFFEAIKNAQKEVDVQKAREIIKKGQDAEYEACKGNIVPPPNMDKMGDGKEFI